MNFSKNLNEVIKTIGCSSKEISEESKISPAGISRYRNGNRTPKIGSVHFINLVNSLYSLSVKKGVNLDKNEIENTLKLSLNKSIIDANTFKVNFNYMIKNLKINSSDLAKYIGFDPSYLSKIKAGIRKPLDIENFINKICDYIVKNYTTDEKIKLVSEVIGCANEEITIETYHNLLYNWISFNNVNQEKYIENFLKTIDNFDYSKHINELDDITVDKSALIKNNDSITFYGIDGLKKSYITLFNQVLQSNNNSDLYYYSNISLKDNSKDEEFNKHYMYGVSAILKKGLTLNVIHNLDKPFNDIIKRIENWIPLFLTGQINSYYFPKKYNRILSYIKCVNNEIVLSGEAIPYSIENSRFNISTKKDEIDYYKNSFKLLINHSNKFVEFYNEKNEDNFLKLVTEIENKKNDVKNIFSKLPVYTMSKELLLEILENNSITDKKEIDRIIYYYEKRKENIKNILSHNIVFDEIRLIEDDELDNNKISISLAQIFYRKKIVYTKDQYKKHLELTKKFKEENKNYIFEISNKYNFKNIDINIVKGNYIIISKEDIYPVHLVFYYPKIVNAIENYEGSN